jgi:Sulfotransferase family
MIHLSSLDYWLARLNYRCFKWLCGAGDIESAWLAGRTEQVDVSQPIYIAGLARSGSTLLLELLSQHPHLATHQYADFPFIAAPYLWTHLRERLGKTKQSEAPRERAHQDGVNVTSRSPESMEEPIWQGWFPILHRGDREELLGEQVVNEGFEKFYRQHLKKILFLRGGQRYLAKNNYLLSRLGYVLRLFPEAKIIVPIRHPIAHVESLVHQHRLFSRYSESDARIPAYMKAAGHYEFGPQRRPIVINLDSAARTTELWKEDDQHLGYALQWASVYGELHRFIDDYPQHRSKICIVHYEQFCSAPAEGLETLLKYCQLDQFEVDLSQVRSSGRTTVEDARLQQQIWDATSTVASQFGYLNIADANSVR